MKREISFYGHMITENEIDEQIEILSSKIEELHEKLLSIGREIYCKIVQGGNLARVRVLMDMQWGYTESMIMYSEKREEFYALWDLLRKRSAQESVQMPI